MSLSLKIRVAGNTKTLQLSGDMSVHEVCREIREKFEGAGGADHGLFYPELGKWLVPSKVLDFYDLKSGDVLEFKKKHRPLKFKTLDGSVKTALVDETLPVQQLVATVCQRIGLSNPDEYSFQPDAPVEQIAKDKSIKKTKNPLAEQIADDARWLNPEKTLAEQGLNEGDVIILKKKFFFTDQNIDRNDPIQLNLLYNQAREAIISGKHPCTGEEAAQFAAIQCQVQFGNHEPDKHKLKDFVPSEYQKSKDVEKKIFHEHRKLQGLSELNAKFRYVQLSRSLKTYGITFFLVKERMAKKNKLILVLLGITKSSIVKLDLESKEIIKQWPLTQLRRWAASPNSFTLDFGDYADAYYSVQTTEGEQISQIIAGYIDLILKKRKEAEKVVPEEEIEEASVEEYIQPGKPTKQVGLVSNGYRVAAETRVEPPTAAVVNGMRSVNENMRMMPELAAVLSQPPEYFALQQTLMATIRSGLSMLKVCSADLNVSAQLPPLGDDPASMSWKQQTIDVNSANIAAFLSSILAAAGSLVNHATGIPDEMEFDLLIGNVNAMTANVTQMCQSIKLLAALSSDGDDILDNTHSVVEGIVHMMDPLQSIAVGEHERKPEFYGAGQELSVASHSLLIKLDKLEVSEDAQHDILGHAYNVSKAVTDLVASARSISKTITDSILQQDIVADARYLFDTCQQLVACISTVTPTLNSQQCADQVMECSMYLRDAVGMLSNSCQSSEDQDALDELLDACQKVEEAIARLVEKTAEAGFVKGGEGTEIDLHHDLVMAAAERMLQSMGDVEAIIGNTKDLTLAASQFVTLLKQKASPMEDADEKSRAMGHAKDLADATSKMVAAAKEAARATSDAEKQEKLRLAVEEVQKAANVAAGAHVRDRVMFKLAQAIKDVIGTSNQLIAAAKAAAPSNRHQASQLQLNQAARKVNEIIPQLTAAIQSYKKSPEDLIYRVKLINLSKQAILPGFAFISIAKLSAPTIGDAMNQSQLLNAARQAEEDIRVLDRASKIAEEVNSEFQVDSALKSIKNIQNDLTKAQQSGLDALPVFTETSPLELFSVASSIQSTIAQLATAASQGNEKTTHSAATDAVMALQALSVAAQGFAAVESDLDFKSQILGAASGVADTLSSLISKAKIVSHSGGHMINPQEFKDLAQGAVEALDTIVEFLPGQKDLEAAITSVDQTISNMPALRAQVIPASDVKEAEITLLQSTSKVTAAANSIVQATKGTLSDLQSSISQFTDAFEHVAVATAQYEVTAKHVNQDTVSVLLNELKESTATLLGAAKAGFAEKENTKARQNLLDSSRTFNRITTKLMDACSNASPEQIKINQAMQSLNDVNCKLMEVYNIETVEQQEAKSSYSDCVHQMATDSKTILTSLNSITQLAKSGDGVALADKLSEVASKVVQLTEANAKAAYLVGVAHLSSTPATKPIIDKAVLLDGAKDIKESCKALLEDSDHSEHDILEVAAAIAKTTSEICHACKTAGQTSSILPQHRQTFISSAKETAARTTSLVTSIREMAEQDTPAARAECASEVQRLLDCVDSLVSFSMSPEFVGSAAIISAQGHEAQKPLIESNKELIAAVENATLLAKQVCSDPNDESLVSQLSATARQVTESVHKLAKTVSASTPGAKECEEASNKILQSLFNVDQALVESSLNTLEPRKDESGIHVVKAFQALSSLIEVTYQVTKNDPTQVGHSLAELPETFDQAANAAVALASQSTEINIQQNILGELKASAETLTEYLKSMKNAVNNSKNAVIQETLDKNKGKLKSSFNKLIGILEGVSEEGVEFLHTIDKIESIISTVQPQNDEESEDKPSFLVLKSQIEETGRRLVETVSDVISVKGRSAEQLKLSCNKIADALESVKGVVCRASGAVDDPKVSDALISSSRDLMFTSIKLVEAMRVASNKSAADATSRAKLTQAARDVSLSVAGVINASKEGSKSLTACQQVISTINDYIADIDGALIFASAGQLDPLDYSDRFSNHKDLILSAAKVVTENVKSFISTVAASQEELSALVHATSNHLVGLKNHVMKGARAITSADKNMQLELLTSAKAVCEANQGLIATAIEATGRPENDPAMAEFGDAIKIQFGTLAELVRLIKFLADESARGERALEGAIEDIEDSMIEIASNEPAKGTALPEEVAYVAKELAAGVATLVSSSLGEKDDVVAASSTIKRNVAELVRSGKASVENAPREQQLVMTASIAKACKATQVMLETLKGTKEQGQENNKAVVQKVAAEIASAISNIVNTANNLVPEGYMDADNPHVMAERELMTAAANIETVAKQLTTIKHIQVTPLKAVESSGFEVQVVEAAKAIAAATGSLVKSATGVQREIVAKSKVVSTPVRSVDAYHADDTWSEGLVSGSKQVTTSMKELCELARLANNGQVEPERVIVAAKAISASTAQLISAATVQSDPNSEEQQRLRAAGKAITAAANQLVKATEESIAFSEEIVNENAANAPAKTKTMARVQELEAQMAILRMEKELEKARMKLAAVRKGKYENASFSDKKNRRISSIHGGVPKRL